MVINERLTSALAYLREAYPTAEAFLLGGSAARGDGIDIQDLDIKIIVDSGGNDSSENGCFLGEKALDLSFLTAGELTDMEGLLSNPYHAGFFNDAILLYDRDGGMLPYLQDFRVKYPQPFYHRQRMKAICESLEKQFHAFCQAIKSGNALAAHCRFATYTWTACDALLIRHLRSPSWIRGLQKVGMAVPSMADKVMEAEGGRHITRQQLEHLFSLYSQLWTGDFWDFLKKEMIWLADNHMEPQAFHSLQICCMMAVESPDRQEAFEKWLDITAEPEDRFFRRMEKIPLLHTEIKRHLLCD